MSFQWSEVARVKERASSAFEFGHHGDHEDKALFEDWQRQVGAALCSRDSGIEFVPRSRTSSWVVRDDCPFVIGYIAYVDNRDIKTGGYKPTYCVHSWAITNDKYSWGNSNRHTKTSGNFDTALKLAKTYLRRPSPSQLSHIKAGLLEKGMRGEFDKHRKNVNTTVDKVVDMVTNQYGNESNHNKRLYKELKHMLDTGYEFLDPEFRSDVEAMVIADQALRDGKVEDVPFYCVMTYESRGRRVFDVVKGTQVNPYSAEIEEQYNRFTEDMLPEDITRKLAVLQMLDSEDFVDGVGVSAGNGVYYVVAD